MKTLSLLGIVLLLGNLPVPAAGLKKENRPPEQRQERMEDRFLPGVERLPEPEQKQLRAARDQALQTPEVQAAMVDRNDSGKDFANVQQTALLAADPKLGPVLEKLKKKGGNLGQLGALAAGRGGPGVEEKLKDLTPEERAQLARAFGQARTQPEVSAARERMQTALQAMRTSMTAAMIKVDPTVRPLLAKLGPMQRRMDSRRQARAQ